MEKNFVSMENFTDFVYYDTGKDDILNFSECRQESSEQVQYKRGKER